VADEFDDGRQHLTPPRLLRDDLWGDFMDPDVERVEVINLPRRPHQNPTLVNHDAAAHAREAYGARRSSVGIRRLEVDRREVPAGRDVTDPVSVVPLGDPRGDFRNHREITAG
jgi:hypothetical protein